MKKIVLAPNPYRDRGLALTMEAKSLLERDGFEVVISPTFVDVPSDSRMQPLLQAAEGAELIITLGGDGTMLRLARAAAQQELPLLGVNVGHIGFMTELEPDELGRMEKLFTGEYSIDSRMMLHAVVRRGGRAVYEDDALNDIVVAKGTAFRVVRVRIAADEEDVTGFSGDGVIVATPTGSTAYGLSAGGPVIEPSAENMAVIPICAHALAAKSCVFAPERRISIRAACEGGSEVFLSVDGGQGFAIRPDDVVEITRSALRSRLVRLKGDSFYKILQQKL